MIRSDIKNIIREVINRKFGNIEIPDFAVKAAENSEHGDYTTNIALLLAGALKKSPMEIAEAIAAELKVKRLKLKVEIAPPGFINIWLFPEILYAELNKILDEKKNYGRLKDKSRVLKINIEFISANPTGPLTIGNGRGAFLGDALANVLKFYGHKVTREYYINDARASAQIQELGKAILGRGEAYKGSYTDEIRKRIEKKFYRFRSLKVEDAGYAAAQEIQRDNKKFIERVLKIKFDIWYSEERLYKNRLVKKTFETLNKNETIYVKDGAHWFRASKFGDTEDRVAVRADGTPTYFLPDVAYHAEKLTKRKFDKIIDILGADHFGTFPRVLGGLRALGLDASQVTAIFTQIVRLMRDGKEVKMSKRRGIYITLEELIKEVGPDAARYFFLEKSPDTHMNFDLNLAEERSVKNPVYYIQYAHARISSIFKKVKDSKLQIPNEFKIQNSKFKILDKPEEVALIKKLIQFPDIIEDTANDYQVHRLTRYAYEISRSFHNFYEKHRVISEDKELNLVRLALVKATQNVLRNTLDLLGISAPEKM